jgi:hypothetical protein
MSERGLMRRPIPSRGGQLEIAGVVVGQWGANYGQPGRLPQPLQGLPRGRLPPQVGLTDREREADVARYNNLCLYAPREPEVAAAGEAYILGDDGYTPVHP